MTLSAHLVSLSCPAKAGHPVTPVPSVELVLCPDHGPRRLLDRPVKRGDDDDGIEALGGRRRRPWSRYALGAGLLLAATLLRPAGAQSVEEFYRGRNVTIAIGFSVGGGYDLYARLLARHLGRHIPGQPRVVAQNREGAGSERATLYLYNAAPRDGTVIGAFSRSMAVAPLIAGAPFDATRLTWIGSISTDVSVCFTWNTSSIKTFDDMLATPFTMGGLGGGADPDIFALMLRNVFGAKLKLVSGYPGTNDATLAMERGEVSGVCGISWSTVKSRHMDWVKAHRVNMPVQFGLQKEADIPDVPAVIDLVKGDEQSKMVRLILAGQAMARPYAAPPGIPEDRRNALVAAFEATMKDPEFLADAQKMQADVNPVTAAEIEKLLAEIYATPKDVVAKAAKAIAN
jgi:tripartite-type tricarboxylate transporter receptor subunit TctC